ncbi:class I SAM-dependent methyltransferase [Pseudonocardia sp. KRD291]|uniref:class I SAM-dependent methyltransferase n=1 Tax=Pseudonocardia sp. KRD291 TaxID=2792007 RepID=UPI001C4A0B20|nr:class I SAM-dependent methyltransferase [Pseudonocardia sp. KRD291]MBW0103470.1 class I SAM-dependent methyltransferase [Pseudonocardia sp. KRD291]
MLAPPERLADFVSWPAEPEHVGRWPVYVDYDDSILDRARLLAGGGASEIERGSGVTATLRRTLRRVTNPDGRTRRNVDVLVDTLVGNLDGERDRATVLVVGGGEIGNGADRLYSDPRVEVLAFDIYAGPNVQFVADAHRIPFSDGSVDAVVVQAVLEHVLDPARVVAEIHRVLAPDGLVYAETPFLQQVHEGPYDFTRFTESGHRWLFRAFSRIDSGVVGGPGVQLIWTLGAVAAGLSRSRAVGRATRLALFWLRFLDRVVPQNVQVDGACGVYFLGRRAETPLSPAQMPGQYRGAQ